MYIIVSVSLIVETLRNPPYLNQNLNCLKAALYSGVTWTNLAGVAVWYKKDDTVFATEVWVIGFLPIIVVAYILTYLYFQFSNQCCHGRHGRRGGQGAGEYVNAVVEETEENIPQKKKVRVENCAFRMRKLFKVHLYIVLILSCCLMFWSGIQCLSGCSLLSSGSSSVVIIVAMLTLWFISFAFSVAIRNKEPIHICAAICLLLFASLSMGILGPLCITHKIKGCSVTSGIAMTVVAYTPFVASCSAVFYILYMISQDAD